MLALLDSPPMEDEEDEEEEIDFTPPKISQRTFEVYRDPVPDEVPSLTSDSASYSEDDLPTSKFRSSS